MAEGCPENILKSVHITDSGKTSVNSDYVRNLFLKTWTHSCMYSIISKVKNEQLQKIMVKRGVDILPQWLTSKQSRVHLCTNDSCYLNCSSCVQLHIFGVGAL